jgi:GTP-binding protein HflX
VVDISHSDFEEQLNVVKETLAELNANDKPTILLFNKIDAYTFIEKDPDDLTPATKENLSLEDLKKTWMAKSDVPALFISAIKKQNIEEFKKVLYKEVKKIHMVRYPYNDYLYNIEEHD